MAKPSEVLTRLLLDNKEYIKGLREASSELAAFGTAALDMGKKLMTAGGLILAPLALAVNEAGKLQRAVSNFDAAFGSQAGAARKWAAGLADELGRSQRGVMAFAAGWQELARQQGLADAAAADFSQTLTRLQYDLAAYRGVAEETLTSDFQSYLNGNIKALEKHNLVISQAAIDQQLFNQGLNPENATAQEKALARLNTLLAATAGMQGAAARRSGEFANTLTGAKEAVMDAAAAVGGVLLPVVNEYLAGVAAAAKATGEWAQEHPVLVKGVAGLGVALTALGAVYVVVGTGAKVASGAVTLWGTASKAATLATVGLGKAMLALAFNPVVLGFTLVAAAVAAVAVGLMSAQAAQEDYNRLQRQRAADELAAARAIRSRVDSETAADQARIGRLRELERQEKLTTGQQLEASGIISDMADRYGTLVGQIDAATGALRTEGDALDSVNRKMIERQQLAINLEKQKVERSYQLAVNQFNEHLENSATTGAWTAGHYLQLEDLSMDEWRERYKSSDSGTQQLLKPILDLADDYVKLTNDENELHNPSDRSGQSAQADALAQYITAEKALAELEKSLAAARMSEYERERQKLAEIRDERLKNLGVMERSLAVQRQETEGGLLEAEGAEAEALMQRLLAIGRAEKQLDDDRRTALEDYSMELERVAAAERRKGEDLLAAHRADRDAATARRRELEDGRRLDNLAESDPLGYRQELERLLEDAIKARNAADQAVEAAIIAANADGSVDADEEAAIAGKRSRYADSQRTMEALESRLDAALNTQQTGGSQGTFSAQVAGMIAGGTAAERTAKAAEDSADYLETIKTITADLAETFKFRKLEEVFPP